MPVPNITAPKNAVRRNFNLHLTSSVILSKGCASRTRSTAAVEASLAHLHHRSPCKAFLPLLRVRVPYQTSLYNATGILPPTPPPKDAAVLLCPECKDM